MDLICGCSTVRVGGGGLQAGHRLNPSNASAYVNLATSYAALRNDQEAVKHYQQAFDLNPALKTDLIVNHEYGFVLIRLGDLDRAAAHFGQMLAEKSSRQPGARAPSLGLLETYRGRYSAGIDHLKQAIVINRTNKALVSEFRDRLFLARAYRAKGMAQAAAEELDAVHRLATTSTLAPEWLSRLGRGRSTVGPDGTSASHSRPDGQNGRRRDRRVVDQPEHRGGTRALRDRARGSRAR